MGVFNPFQMIFGPGGIGPQQAQPSSGGPRPTTFGDLVSMAARAQPPAGTSPLPSVLPQNRAAAPSPPLSGPVPPAPVGPSPEPGNPFDNYTPFGGQNPWVRDVTLNQLNEKGENVGLQHLATERPSVQFVTPQTAQQVGNMFGGNVTAQSQDMGPFGTLSNPEYTVNFPGQPNNLGYDVNVDAGQIAFWLARGDPEWLIRERLGLSPQTVGRF